MSRIMARMSARQVLSLAEVAHPDFAIRCAKELLGTFMIVFIGTGAVQGFVSSGAFSAAPVTVALGFGTAVGTALWVTRGELNPALSFAMMVVGRASALRCLLFCLAQLAGAMLASSVIFVVTPGSMRGVLGSTVKSTEYGVGQAFTLEMYSSLLLAIVVWSAAVNPGANADIAPAVIGIAVAGLHLVLAYTTGAGLNPARSFGPAVLSDTWDDHWIYWVAPTAGFVLGAVIFEMLFMIPETSAEPSADGAV